MSTLLEERPATRDPEVTVRLVTEEARRGGGGGGRFSGGNVLTTAGLGAIAIAILLVVGAITGLVDVGGIFDGGTKTTSSKVLLKELKDLSSFDAAQGTYQVDVDKDGNAPILPDFIWADGGDFTFRAVGTVDATVDFSVLATDAVQVASEGKAVSITLPPVDLRDAVVDPKRSKIISQKRGLFDRIADAFSDPATEREFYVLGAKKITKAARESALQQRAEKNTIKFLEAFLARLGFTDVNVTFEKPAPANAKK
jgi:hypothetical protein